MVWKLSGRANDYEKLFNFQEGPLQEEAEPGEAEKGKDSEQNQLDNFIVDEEGNPLTGKGKRKRKNKIPTGEIVF